MANLRAGGEGRRFLKGGSGLCSRMLGHSFYMWGCEDSHQDDVFPTSATEGGVCFVPDVFPIPGVGIRSLLENVEASFQRVGL